MDPGIYRSRLGKPLDREAVRFFYIAKGSVAELRTQLQIGFEIGYLERDVFENGGIMEVLFLYDRHVDICKKQLKALKDRDLELVEKLAEEREQITGRIIELMRDKEVSRMNRLLRQRIREYTDEILSIDQEIKSILLDELYDHAIRIFTLNP